MHSRCILAGLCLLLSSIPAHGWELTRTQDPASKQLVVTLEATARAEQSKEPHTLRISLTSGPKPASGAVLEIEYAAARPLPAGAENRERRLTFRVDRNPAATATWQRAHEGARFGHIALPTEEAAVAPVRRQFDTLEAEFAAQWYPQLTALRNEIVNRAKTAARVTSLIGAAKQLTVSSLLNPADTVTFSLDSAFAGFRKQLQTAMDAARAQSETDDKRLADARRLLEKKREHSRLVDERKRAVEARVATARGKSGNSSAFKEALSDALLQAVFEVEVGRTAFDAVILIHVRPNGRLALHNELAASLPKTVANAVHSFSPRPRSPAPSTSAESFSKAGSRLRTRIWAFTSPPSRFRLPADPLESMPPLLEKSVLPTATVSDPASKRSGPR